MFLWGSSCCLPTGFRRPATRLRNLCGYRVSAGRPVATRPNFVFACCVSIAVVSDCGIQSCRQLQYLYKSLLFLSLSPQYYANAAPGLLAYPAVVKPPETTGRSLQLYFPLLRNHASPCTEPFKCGSVFSFFKTCVCGILRSAQYFFAKHS